MNHDVLAFHSWYALKLKQPACFVRKCCIRGKSQGYGTIEEIMNKQSPSIKTVQQCSHLEIMVGLVPSVHRISSGVLLQDKRRQENLVTYKKGKNRTKQK